MRLTWAPLTRDAVAAPLTWIDWRGGVHGEGGVDRRGFLTDAHGGAVDLVGEEDAFGAGDVRIEQRDRVRGAALDERREIALDPALYVVLAR